MPQDNSAPESGAALDVPQDETIIATLMPSRARRFLATGMLSLLGALLILLALNAPALDMSPGIQDLGAQDLGAAKGMGPGARVFLLLSGAFALIAARKLYKATERGLELTQSGVLRETGPQGRILANVEDLKGVERGSFAFKPSNGFSLIYKVPQKRGFAPGLWWRTSKRLGVGGVTPASQGKFMAELIVAQIAGHG